MFIYIYIHPDNLWVSLRISSNDNRFWWMFFSVFRWCFPWWLSAHLAGKLTKIPWDFITLYYFADRPKRTLDKPSSFNIICHTPLTPRSLEFGASLGRDIPQTSWPSRTQATYKSNEGIQHSSYIQDVSVKYLITGVLFQALSPNFIEIFLLVIVGAMTFRYKQTGP